MPALSAADWTHLRPEGSVSDFARVLTPASRAAIESYLARLEQATGAQVAIVTLPSLKGDPIEEVANQIYRSFGVGRKQTDEGALFLISIAERRTRLEVGYGLEPVLPDGTAGSILRGMRPALREKQYVAALETAAAAIGERIAAAKGVTIPGEFRRRPSRDADDFPLPVLLVLLGLLLLMALSAGGRSRYRRWGGPWIFPGGGGFGGAASGGGSSWGGVGGGDSGGGGASSDW